MPNGYTTDIYDGKPVTLTDYLMGVGRSMGFAIMQRDEAASEPVRTVEPQTSYHDKAISAARATLAEVDALSVAEAVKCALVDYEKANTAWLEARDRIRAMRSRYEEMIRQVEAWHPDPLVLVVKEQALKYLRESVKFDCGDEKAEMRWSPPPRRLSGPEWINERRAKARRDIEYHEAERKKEIERTEERNRWITAFLGSLPASQSSGGQS